MKKLAQGQVEARIKELVENLANLAELLEPLLIVRRSLRAHSYAQPDQRLDILQFNANDGDVIRSILGFSLITPILLRGYFSAR
jgi:hypothetical protein